MLGYTTAAVLAVIAITSAHYSQTRADEVATPGTANAARAQGAAPARQYLPQLTLPEHSPGTPPSVPSAPHPAPTTQAIAEPEPVAVTTSTEPSATREPAPSTTSEHPSSTPSTSTPVPSEPSPQPTQPSETTQPSEPSETTEPPTSEPTQPSEPDETTEPSTPSQPGLLPLVGGVVDGLTDPLLGR
ncbi:hypothetical protein [Saccharopolyspora dendranthemae]|uniref:hypothetical protein n=1 Tax=Saccharopolyspora dendranthemae TaxID=1181886 RepID=UPI0011A7CA48|nr:hypothetical protein [Saccharopolyspora dendranthemae]